MDIRNTKQLKSFALERLENTPAQKRIVWIYAGAVMGLSVVVTVLQYVLGLQISQTEGLGSMGLRSVLSALQMMLPMILSGIMMCLGTGYLAAMLRIARGQYVSPNTLRLGFDRFWKLLRLTLIEGLLCAGIFLVALYAAVAIFLLTPLSRSTMEVLMEISGEMTTIDPYALVEDPRYYQLAQSMMPVFWISMALFLAAVSVMMFRLRLAQYLIVDRPALGALAAMRESRRMTCRNCRNLLRLDLSLWWYYAAALAVSVVGYGDQILPMLGVALPFSDEAAYYLFYGIYHVLQLALCVTLRNRVETAYALAYDALCPKAQSGNGVVLGNIFQM